MENTVTKKIEDCTDMELKSIGFDLASVVEQNQMQIREIVGELARRAKTKREAEDKAVEVIKAE